MTKIDSLSALVAQLDRALASGAKGCGFDPRRAQISSGFSAVKIQQGENDSAETIA